MTIGALNMMVLSMAACGKGTGTKETKEVGTLTETEQEDTQKGETKTWGETNTEKKVIGITFNDVSGDSYQTAFYETLLEDAEKRGYEMAVLDAAGDADAQINQVENLMEMNVDLLMVFPCNGTSIVPALKKAYDAGFQTLIINNNIDESGKPYVLGYVGPDNIMQGQDAAKTIIDYYEKNDPDIEEISVIQIEHVPGNMTAVQRGQGFKEGIEGSKVKIIESQTANNSREEAMQITENFLIKYPNKGDIDAIFIQGDNMAHGVMAAIDAAGRTGEFPVVGTSITAEIWEKMEKGMMWGSSLQSPYLLSETVMDTADAIFAGKSIEYWNAMPNPIITQDNQSEYTCPDW